MLVNVASYAAIGLSFIVKYFSTQGMKESFLCKIKLECLTHVPIFTKLVSPHCVTLLMDGAKLCIENTVVEPMPLE